MIGHPLFNYYVATLEMQERRNEAERMRRTLAARRARRTRARLAAPRPTSITEDDLFEQEREATLVA